MTIPAETAAILRAARNRRDFCGVVNQHCIAPPSEDLDGRVRSVCVGCGEHVCTECSIVRDWYGDSRQRICHHCIAQHDGDDGREQVAAAIYVGAGYPAEVGVRAERSRMAYERGVRYGDSAALAHFLAERERVAAAKLGKVA